MKVSASFLSSRDLVKDLKVLDLTDVDYIHLDIMDGKFVDNKTMPYSELKNIYKYTSKRLDVHLMVEDPERYIPLYAALNTEYITFHVEVESDIINPICDCLINIGLHPFRIHDAIYLPENEVCAIPFNIKEKIIQSINEKG